jgi:hypothetical protein
MSKLKTVVEVEKMKAVWRRIRRPSRKTLNGLPVVTPQSQPSWDYKPVLRHNRNRIMPLLIALVMFTASVASSFAMIGETPQQFEPREPDEVTQLDGVYQDGVYMEWFGKRYRHAGWFYNGHAMTDSFQRSDGRPLTADDFNRFLKAYSSWTFGQYQRTTDKDYALAYQNGRVVGAMFLHKSTYILEFVNAFALARMEQSVNQQTRSVPFPDPTPRVAPQDENTCMIVATAHYHDVKDKSPWANIVRFQIYINGQRQWGHAMTVWKITSDGKVQVNDESGTFELNTTSTALEDVTNALSMSLIQILHAKGVQGDITLEKASFATK